MPLPFQPLGPPLDDGALRQVEARLGWRLPEAYAALLRQEQNGGWLGGIDVEGHEEVGLSSLFGLGLGTATDLDLEYANAQMRGRLPEGLVAIADASGGNLLCISTRRGDWGTIWFWDHELEDLFEGAVSKVCDDFQGLLDALVLPRI